MNLDKDVMDLKEIVVNHRRWLHQHPGTGFEVEEARDYILEHLRSLDFDEVTVLAGTGVKAVIRSAKPQKTYAFRADMDALSMKEDTGLSFASSRDGQMHGCGHDGHMAILLGFAQWLHDHKTDLKHNVVLIFQPAEESVGGALPMIDAGVLDEPSVDAIFGFHIMPEIPQGMIGIKADALMAQTCEFDIELFGKSAHGAMPHRGVDTILASANLITSIQGIITSRIDPFEQALISIGRLEAGDLRNIVADKAIMKGIIRTFNDEVYRSIKGHLEDLIIGLAKSHGIVGFYKEIVYYPAVINHKEWTGRIMNMLQSEDIYSVNPMMIAEDFSYYQQKVPGVFMFLGSRNEALGYTYPLHSCHFDFHEDILLNGIQLYKNILISS